MKSAIWKTAGTVLLCCCFFSQKLFATHNRAGEIIYKVIAPFQIQATIITYTRQSSIQADRDSLLLNWGDGNTSLVLRTNGPVGGSGIPNGEPIGNDIKKNLYTATHTYAGAAPPPKNFYLISMQDINRIAGITNIQNGNSVDIPFYIEDTIKFPTDLPNIGFNSSPILLNPPIDFANVGDTFYHNPLAFDADGDSLTFEQIPPLQTSGVNVPSYQYPKQVIPSATNTEYLNTATGEYTWAVPQMTGIYNVAFIIREFRRGFLLSTMIRDMQILVEVHNNNPPQIAGIRDTCVRAGDPLLQQVTARDPDVGQLVTLSANGGPLIFPSALSPATFPTVTGPSPVQSTFRWNTICDHIQRQQYQVVFRAEDNYVDPSNQAKHLVDLQSWLIRVIGPPPLNVQAQFVNKKAQITWSTYKCAQFAEFRGFSVWKKINSNPFVPDYCETGLDGRGYTKIAEKLFDTMYVDADVIRGQDVCYRVLAHFSKKSPNGIYEYDQVVSVPSNESCLILPFDVPVITNVSVVSTATSTGQMYVEWTKPRAGVANLDTILNPPPYRFDLYRGTGFNFNNPALINSVSRNSFAELNDTTFTDSNLNTADSAYSYQVQFYSQTDTIGATNKASSVYLSVQSSDESLVLSWKYNVPWTQDTFQVFRKNKSTNLFDYLATTASTSFVDTGLINDSTYCYYVKAFGHYSAAFIKKPLINNSEEKCGVPQDTLPPCPPHLTITNDCSLPVDTFSFINHLSWTIDSCAADAVLYRIYFSEDSGNLRLIDSVVGINDTLFNHITTDNIAGCYVVTAVDRVGNESAKNNVVCIDNCPVYNLPNTFTPNGDGSNDFFTPIHPYRFVSRVEFKVFNRWGDKIFETTDPEIRWDGKDQKTKTDVSDGVYLYAGYYYETHFGKEIKKPLPSGKGGGFIHLIRGK
ncbi:MAG: gliding motility-associated C-terminal domain-containing protein [Chitinophagales bacterium]